MLLCVHDTVLGIVRRPEVSYTGSCCYYLRPSAAAGFPQVVSIDRTLGKQRPPTGGHWLWFPQQETNGRNQQRFGAAKAPSLSQRLKSESREAGLKRKRSVVIQYFLSSHLFSGFIECEYKNKLFDNLTHVKMRNTAFKVC